MLKVHTANLAEWEVLGMTGDEGDRAAALPSRNEDWGFFGTIARAGFEPRAAWAAAFERIAEAADAHDDHGPEGVRDFLDSRWGRHFADMVEGEAASGAPLAAAIDAAVARHMAWRTDRRTEREDGIPRGLPWLAGWVRHFAICAEMEEA